MRLIDFTCYLLTDDIFTGSEKKIGVFVEGSRYMLKFQKKDQLGLRNNHISEFLGSSIFSMLGVKAQETMLGTYNGEYVIACRVFTDEHSHFVPFNDVGESSWDQDTESMQYTYDDIMCLLKSNKKLTAVEETIDTFWDIFIIDGLLGNFDRHGSNWGFLKNDNRYSVAPVFDNGSCLYPRMTDELMMAKLIDSEEMTAEHIYRFPTSKILLDGKKSSYFDVISSLRFDECNRALLRIFPKIDLFSIDELIDSIDIISDIQKKFYKHMIRARYERILLYSYKRLIG